MKVRMKVEVSGHRNGRPWPRRGEVIDLPDEEAAGLCSSGMAEPAGEEGGEDVERAVPPPAEKTTAPAAEKTTRPAAERRTRRAR